MKRAWFVAGTDTGVGKTHVSCGLLQALACRGRTVAGMKPVASGCHVSADGLRNAWAVVDDAPHVHGFIDMHDLGDALMRTQFAEPVMDMEHITLTYADVLSVMRDLKAIGAHNVARGRSLGLLGKQRYARFVAAYESARLTSGRIPATYEVVYGHAWAPLVDSGRGVPRTDGVVRIPIERIRRRGYP